MPCQAATGYQLLASIPFFPFQYRSPRLTPTFPQVLNPPVGSSNLCQFCCPIRLRPGKVDLPCLLQSYVYSHIASFSIFLPTIASSSHWLGFYHGHVTQHSAPRATNAATLLLVCQLSVTSHYLLPHQLQSLIGPSREGHPYILKNVRLTPIPFCSFLYLFSLFSLLVTYFSPSWPK
jgi:hypothetical protein